MLFFLLVSFYQAFVMQILLLCDNIRYGQFVQKGLLYENLPVELWSLEKLSSQLEEAFLYDGVLLLFRRYDTLRETAVFLRQQKKGSPLFALVDTFTPQVKDLHEKDLVSLSFTRPFSFRTIASEMKFCVFEAKEQVEQSLYIFRDLKLDVLSHTVWYKNVPVPLRNKEFFLLHFLMSNPGKVLSRCTILENVWDRNANILTNTVDVHMSQLRKKIEGVAREKFIRTVPCAGYIFC